VLAELVAEMNRRNELFQRLHVADYAAYRTQQGNNGCLPRLVLVVDEYQQLFEGDTDGRASDCLLKLSAMGRSSGISVLLGSQRFTATGMEHRQAILGNFHLRLGMKMQRDDVEALTEFGRNGKNLLHTCDNPGKVVVNERAGDDDANVPGKVALLQPQRREELLARLEARAAALPPEALPRRVVFNGRSQPALLDNRHLVALLERPAWLTPLELEALARKPLEQDGFGVEHWYAAEQPRIAWLGQELNVRGLARLVLRRQASENVLIVGNQNAARYGMLAALVVGTAVNLGPNDTQFVILDRSIAGSQWSGTLEATCRALLAPCGIRCRFTRQGTDLEKVLADLTAELDRRRGLAELKQVKQSALIVVMTELDTVDGVRRVPGQFGLTDAPLGKVLGRLLADGPRLGLHLVLSFGRWQQVQQVLDPRGAVKLIGHRVALQMGEEDSHDLLGDRSAAKLQADGPTPVCAVYRDLSGGIEAVRFKPCSTEPQEEGPDEALVEQVRRIGARLRKRG
jgi:S-DNA-T family DNA segregation ATPase FtsK/SpoIIIE